MNGVTLNQNSCWRTTLTKSHEPQNQRRTTLGGDDISAHVAVGWVLRCLTGIIMSTLAAILWTRRERSYQIIGFCDLYWRRVTTRKCAHPPGMRRMKKLCGATLEWPRRMDACRRTKPTLHHGRECNPTKPFKIGGERALCDHLSGGQSTEQPLI